MTELCKSVFACSEDVSIQRASWIWLDANGSSYNQAAVFRRQVDLPTRPLAARILFSADTVARIVVNGQWVADGPCRGWPHAYYYDVVDVTPYLKAGGNTIEAIVRYHGVGTFHQIPQRAGFLLQLDVRDGAVWRDIVATDTTWQASPYRPWQRTTPKTCIQMGPAEWHDAREELCTEDWRPAEVVAAAHEGPWGRLRPRDVALPQRYETPVPTPQVMRVVTASSSTPWSVPVTHLCHPSLIMTNIHTSRGGGLATILRVDQRVELPLDCPDWIVFCRGHRCETTLPLESGDNPVLCFVRKLFHNTFDAVFSEPRGEGVRAVNPLSAEQPFAWCWIPLPEFDWMENDFWWFVPPRPDRQKALQEYETFCTTAAQNTCATDVFCRWLSDRGQVVLREQIAWEDPHAAFKQRQERRVLVPSTSGQYPLRVEPQPDGDTELQIDLGDLFSGYLRLDVEATSGSIIDMFLVEHVARDGRVQHTGDARNGLRYVCRSGRHQFMSLVRRSGRYLFLTLRNLTGPVVLHKIGLTETRYPTRCHGYFRCSDERLNALFSAAQRTMELSMDDVYVDSLYEQALWIGDMRTEQLYGMWNFDARDLSLRCLRLGAQSLARLPLVGAQVPSSWEVILPAWSFLWGIAVWEYYFYSGDTAALKELWPAVRLNLVNAETYLNDHGLFDAPFWNFFDWTPMDSDHRCVLYNSMLMVGAIDAAIQCGKVLREDDELGRLQVLRRRIVAGLNSHYDDQRQAYPDALRADGKPAGLSIHPQFLALLHDVAPVERREHLLELLSRPPDGMTGVGSPFMFHFMYEAWDRYGRVEDVLTAMRRNYGPMLDAGATTLWEALPGSLTSPPGWPTRSHCHGWSASPLYFLPRVVLGIRAMTPGGREFEISPHLGDLEWAEGAVATPHGPVFIRVERRGDQVHVDWRTPSDSVHVKLQHQHKGTM